MGQAATSGAAGEGKDPVAMIEAGKSHRTLGAQSASLVFGGLCAPDTQRLKLGYAACAGDQRAMAVATSCGALSLLLNSIHLLQFLLLRR